MKTTLSILFSLGFGLLLIIPIGLMFPEINHRNLFVGLWLIFFLIVQSRLRG